jgi:hypothetical protein
MKNIGGEIDSHETKYYEYATDSGRSSLKLILKSLKNKTFLIPDFTCEIIIKVLDEKKIKYSFYKINKNLMIDFNSIKKQKNYEVLYIINFFGNYQKLPEKYYRNKILIEDNVFLPKIENLRKTKNWISFNSLRKISSISDGSIVKSTIKLNSREITKQNANFVKYKNKGKKLKFDYLNGNFSNLKELDYLLTLENGEKILNKQKKIFHMSNYSYFRYFDFLNNFEKELKIRKKNYTLLQKKLKKYSLLHHPIFPSFFPILHPARNDLKNYLMSKNIYLPIHWPIIKSVNNNLYKKIISIPVDSRYNEKDMKRISKLIINFKNNL